MVHTSCHATHLWRLANQTFSTADSEDSEDDVDYRGNRGQKLNKRARFAHEGQLAPASGPEAYKEARIITK